MPEQVGIENTKEVVKLGFEGAKVFKAAKADGKIDLADLGKLMLLLPYVGPAVADADKIPAELKDMDSAEADELVEFAAAELGGLLEREKVVARVEAALGVAKSISKLVKLI